MARGESAAVRFVGPDSGKTGIGASGDGVCRDIPVPGPAEGGSSYSGGGRLSRGSDPHDMPWAGRRSFVVPGEEQPQPEGDQQANASPEELVEELHDFPLLVTPGEVAHRTRRYGNEGEKYAVRPGGGITSPGAAIRSRGTWSPDGIPIPNRRASPTAGQRISGGHTHTALETRRGDLDEIRRGSSSDGNAPRLTCG